MKCVYKFNMQNTTMCYFLSSDLSLYDIANRKILYSFRYKSKALNKTLMQVSRNVRYLRESDSLSICDTYC